jgi:nicotinamidase-related amidase
MLPELTEAFPQSPVIARTSIGAWEDERFVEAFEVTKRNQLIISGIATDAGVAFTVLSARAADMRFSSSLTRRPPGPPRPSNRQSCG